MPAVSDSTVLINLAATDLLSILPELYHQILVPPAVWSEITTASRWEREIESFHGAVQKGWLMCVQPGANTLTISFPSTLGIGEMEAISVSMERNSLLLIDDLAGREFARRLHLQVAGTLGILLKAKAIGKVSFVKPILHQLIEKKAF